MKTKALTKLGLLHSVALQECAILQIRVGDSHETHKNL